LLRSLVQGAVLNQKSATWDLLGMSLWKKRSASKRVRLKEVGPPCERKEVLLNEWEGDSSAGSLLFGFWVCFALGIFWGFSGLVSLHSHTKAAPKLTYAGRDLGKNGRETGLANKREDTFRLAAAFLSLAAVPSIFWFDGVIQIKSTWGYPLGIAFERDSPPLFLPSLGWFCAAVCAGTTHHRPFRWIPLVGDIRQQVAPAIEAAVPEPREQPAGLANEAPRAAAPIWGAKPPSCLNATQGAILWQERHRKFNSTSVR
jgi:hypothetical protein